MFMACAASRPPAAVASDGRSAIAPPRWKTRLNDVGEDICQPSSTITSMAPSVSGGR